MPGFAHSTLIAAVFLNGVNIDGVRSQTFEKCRTVRLDEKGDVHLDCPGYQVESPAAAPGPRVPGAPAPPPAAPPPALSVAAAGVVPPQLTRHYFLVTEQGEGGAQYDVDVFINSKWLRKLRGGEDQIVLDISSQLQPGPNKLLFAATRRAAPGRAGASPAAYLKIIVGEGERGGGNVLIDNPLIESKRTAGDAASVNEEFTLQAR